MKVIPEKIIENCNICDYRIIDMGLNCFHNHYPMEIPPDCPLKDYQPEQWLDKPDSEGWWWYWDKSFIGAVPVICIVFKKYDIKEFVVQFLSGEKGIVTKYIAKWKYIPEPKEDK